MEVDEVRFGRALSTMLRCLIFFLKVIMRLINFENFKLGNCVILFFILEKIISE
jgi:hypothetical protein